MAKRGAFKMSVDERQRRTFSTAFKKEKVRKIELGLVKVSEICKLYEVSVTAVYRWINIYGTQKKTERLVMQSSSDEKMLLDLKARLVELEQIVGQKQIEIEFYKKMVDLAEDHYDIDIKKNFSTRQSGNSGYIENDTASV